ncbi:MAG: ABC transporter ATP-binding protein [Dehalococcoidia bacterium]
MTLSIETANLTLRYGDTVAIRDLSLQLDGRKIHGLLGRNGSGKTTLLSVLAGFRKPSRGEVRIGGQPVFDNAEVMPQVCLIREAGDVEMNESVREALDLAGYLRPNWDAGYAANLLERFGVPLNQKVKALSRGKQSALGITLGLASRAPVTMFDESYLGLDAPSRYLFYDELLADFMAHPRTIIVSTHLIEEVGSLFEEVVIIDEGKLLLHDDVESLRERGAAITGPADLVDRFVDSHRVLATRQLGRTKSVTVYGELDATSLRDASTAGLGVEPIALQDLFVHLTAPKGGDR